MAGKIQKANQRLPGGVVSEGAKSGSRHQGGGGTKSKDAAAFGHAQPNQQMPKGISCGTQGEYCPPNALKSRDYHGTRAQPNQKLPSDHWDGTNVSQGKSVGAVRAADAYQGPRKEQADPTPRKPGS